MVKPALSSALTCPNYHPDVSQFVLTGAAASNWLRAGVGLESNVSGQAEVLQTTQMVRREWQIQVETPALLPCLRSLFARTYAAEGARLISFRPILFPRIATYRKAIRQVRFVAEFVFMAKSRTELELELFAPVSSQRWVASEAVRLARALVSRVRA